MALFQALLGSSGALAHNLAAAERYLAGEAEAATEALAKVLKESIVAGVGGSVCARKKRTVVGKSRATIG